MADVTYSLKELVSRAATAENLPLSERMARQYISDGLISAPRARGGATVFGDEHLLQLRLVMRLASQYVQARDIQKFVGRLTQDGIRALVDGTMAPRLPSEGDATAYLTRLSKSIPVSLGLPASFRESLPSAARQAVITPRTRVVPIADLPRSPAAAGSTPGIERSSWLRVAFDADVELHVRIRPGADGTHLLDSLIAAVQDVLATERGADV